ncbi:hypothetical protein PHSY_007462 [Pseudozyma hubeiensis SY62]|uniref:Uncharacterized protein n=1 Tax=Pseudozyma hubeiensis (strain SY62) TaxID=1305764 RepID=R9PES1_PSEHS|nr:hypothetical protein PHSY_007462 [Pseudozyma hubeiensis SY62]GAC99859.1 hypothetical protein PHSY_007462 [Pseudozyma hubeiensis SY62]
MGQTVWLGERQLMYAAQSSLRMQQDRSIGQPARLAFDYHKADALRGISTEFGPQESSDPMSEIALSARSFPKHTLFGLLSAKLGQQLARNLLLGIAVVKDPRCVGNGRNFGR